MARKRILLSVDEELYKLVKATEGLGKADAEKCVNIMRSWFAEKSLISTQLKKKLKLK